MRWLTSENNYRARAKYDKVAQRTMFLTYDMEPWIDGDPEGEAPAGS